MNPTRPQSNVRNIWVGHHQSWTCLTRDAKIVHVSKISLNRNNGLMMTPQTTALIPVFHFFISLSLVFTSTTWPVPQFIFLHLTCLLGIEQGLNIQSNIYAGQFWRKSIMINSKRTKTDIIWTDNTKWKWKEIKSVTFDICLHSLLEKDSYNKMCNRYLLNDWIINLSFSGLTFLFNLFLFIKYERNILCYNMRVRWISFLDWSCA